MTSLHALRSAVDEARRRDAVLYTVIAWRAPGGDMIDRAAPEPHLRRVWRDIAMRTLRTAWDEALGGLPDDLPVHLLAERGRAGWVLTELADRDDDLLVVGAARRPSLPRRSVARYCVARARCAVLVVPPPPLVRHLDHNALRRRRAVHAVVRGT